MRKWKGFRVPVLSGALFFLFPISTAYADVSWVEREQDCEGFGTELRKFLESLAGLAELGVQEQLELKTILHHACGPKFKSCDFKICQGQSSGTETENQDSRADGTSPSVVTGTSHRPGGIVLNPLAWLDGPLTCEDFTEQVQARYGPLGGLSNIKGEKKKELAYVLDVACSDRFRHCGFKNCPRGAEASQEESHTMEGGDPSSPDPSFMLRETLPDGNEQERVKEYNHLVREHLSRRDTLIQLQKIDEKSASVEWQRFRMPPEVTAVTLVDEDENKQSKKTSSVSTSQEREYNVQYRPPTDRSPQGKSTARPEGESRTFRSKNRALRE